MRVETTRHLGFFADQMEMNGLVFPRYLRLRRASETRYWTGQNQDRFCLAQLRRWGEPIRLYAEVLTESGGRHDLR